MKQECKNTDVFARKLIALKHWNYDNISSEIFRTNYRNIKLILIICMVGFFTLSCEKATSQRLSDEEIQSKRHFIADKIKELYQEKTNQPDTLFRLDPNINEVTEILSSRKVQLNQTREHKDVIRKLLRKKFIYDYQVHYIVVPLENLEPGTIEWHLKTHELLLNTIDKPNAFRMGIAIESTNKEYSMHLLLTEYYLDFDKGVSAIITYELGDVTTRIDLITGKSFVDNLYYNTTNQKAIENLESIRAEKKKIELQQDNRFTVTVRGGLPNLFFMDENGMILSNRNFLLSKKNEK